MSTQDRLRQIQKKFEAGYTYDAVPEYWFDDPAIEQFLARLEHGGICVSQYFINRTAYVCFDVANHDLPHAYQAEVDAQLSYGLSLNPDSIPTK